MTRRRILYVIENASFGGGERSFAELIKGISGELDVYAACGVKEPFCGLIRNAAEIIPFELSRYNLLNVLSLSSIIRKHSIDIVHSQGARADFYAALASRLAGARHISTVAMPVEGFDVGPIKKAFYGFFSRLGESMTDRIIVVSGALEKFMVEKHGLAPGKVSFIPNGVDVERFEKAAPDKEFAARYGLAGKRVVGCAARLVWQKGLEYLIEAMSVLRERDGALYDRTVCVIAGEGEREKSLRDLVVLRGLEGKVILTGFTPHVPAFLKTLDVFVMPSLREGQPIALLEAMAAGKPVVATAIEGVTGTVTDGTDALLVPPADPGALAGAILKLAKDEDMAEVLSRNARDKVSELFSMKSFVSRHSGIYGDLYDRTCAAPAFRPGPEDAGHDPSAVLSGAWSVKGKRRILLVNMAGLGDIVMMTPAVRAIKAAYPDASLELLTIDRSKDLAEGIEGIDRVHSVPIYYRFAGPAALWKFFRTLLALRRERFDALVNFSLVSSRGGLLKTGLINRVVKAGLSSCRVQKGLGKAGDFTFYEDLIEKKSSVALSSSLLAPLGLALRDTGINYVLSGEDKETVAKELAAMGVSGKPLIGFNPGAFRPSRRWPPEYWRKLAALLLEKYPAALVVVTGSPGEKELADSLRVSDRVVPLAGKFTTRESAALYSRLDLFITNDTGPMHLAAAVGTKTVCIFGPGDHWRFAPSVQEDKKRVIRKDIPGCEFPCYKFDCKKPICLDSINPEDVLAAAADLLEGGGKA